MPVFYEGTPIIGVPPLDMTGYWHRVPQLVNAPQCVAAGARVTGHLGMQTRKKAAMRFTGGPRSPRTTG